MKKVHLEYLIHHVFLPPKLPPGADDSTITHDNDRFLAEFVAETAKEYSGAESSEGSSSLCHDPTRWDPLVQMLQQLADWQPYPSKESLLQIFCDMKLNGKSIGFIFRSVHYSDNFIPRRFCCSSARTKRWNHHKTSGPLNAVRDI